jgi:muramidase (phage lysozyme)
MDELKKININKFFSGSLSSSSNVRVNRTNVPAEPVIVSGSDLSQILQVVKQQTELTKVQEVRIIQENRDDQILQGMVGALQQRFISLQRGFANLSSQFQLELQSRKREVDRQERLLLAQYSESSKTPPAQNTTGTVKKTKALEVLSDTNDSEDSYGSANTSILGALGLGAAAMAMESLGTSGGSGGASAGQWKPLLDLIASGEATEDSYESMNPSTYLPGATKMTIAEVDKKATGAVGRYQFMTPKEQATAAGLDPNKDLFSPENQDKMAVSIIENKRQGNAWLAGKLTDEQFSEGLSNEWGALKSASGNVLPGNSGSIDYEKLKTVLRQIRGNQSSTESNKVKSKKSTEISSSPEKESAPPGQVATSQVGSPAPSADNKIVSSYVPSDGGSGTTQPILLPMGASAAKSSSGEQISAGSAIPPGYSKNFNNPYPDVVQAQFNILV